MLTPEEDFAFSLDVLHHFAEASPGARAVLRSLITGDTRAEALAVLVIDEAIGGRPVKPPAQSAITWRPRPEMVPPAKERAA